MERRGEFAGKALVVIPTFNEAENLPRLIPRIFQQNKAFHVLIVDDNSPDGTGRIAVRHKRPEGGTVCEGSGREGEWIDEARRAAT